MHEVSMTSDKVKEKLLKIVSQLEEAIPEIKKMIQEQGFSPTGAGWHESQRPIELSDGVVAQDIGLNEGGKVRISFFSVPKEN